MENDTLSPCDPATLFLQLAQPCDKPHWKHARRIRGKGSQKFIKTLSHSHCTDGQSRCTRYRHNEWGVYSEYKAYRYHRVVSHIAVEVWDNPEQRKKWLTHHKAISRLVPQ